MRKVVLFEYLEFSDNYYGGSEFEAIQNSILQDDEVVQEVSDSEFEDLMEGLRLYNMESFHKIGVVEISSITSSKVTLQSLIEKGRNSAAAKRDKKEANKERAKKAAITRAKNKKDKLAKELGISVEDLEKIQRGT